MSIINNDITFNIPISLKAFSISLILSNIFAHVPLEREVLPFTTVSRWWNQLATERLWYKFRGLRNESRTHSFEKFLKVLKFAKEGKCFHYYGKYLRILELDKLNINYQLILETLECCPRIEVFCISGSRILNKNQIYEIAERLPNLRFLKFPETVEIYDGQAMKALALHCPYLEELELKKDIICDGEVLLSIVEKCKRIHRLNIFEKNYNDDIMIPVIQMIPNLTTLTLYQCIFVSEEFLLNIFKYCHRITTLKLSNITEITTKLVLATADYYKNCSKIMLFKVERQFDSCVEASEKDLKVHLYDCDLGMIINYYIYRKEKLREMRLEEIEITQGCFGIICKGLDLYKLELISITGLKKSDVLKFLSELKNLKNFFIRFATISVEPILEEDKNKIFEMCPSLEDFQWHFQKFSRRVHHEIFR
ncbi:hypothetical protein Glove_144g23 [Diversispora epigaea]|uniref:F-box domain-containing protein n=1 Tax=Diversispora epigaea TaxID=1348612 RepID=A0A397J3U6_9GLOM|nr:hypothetical protein Glove_144g23 [Diversispora epigaea]